MNSEEEREAEELANADDMSASEGDAAESSGSSYSAKDDDEESLAPDDYEDEQENVPQFLIKHKCAIPPLPENAKCLICNELKPAFFADCKHYCCCFRCYQDTYTAAARGAVHDPDPTCETCRKKTTNYYYRVGAIEEEEAFAAAKAAKKRKRFTCVDTFERDKIPEGFVLPKVSQCTVTEKGVRCKQAAYYLADHGCYTGFCFDHEDRLSNECPICGKDVSYYHKHERAPVPAAHADRFATKKKK